MFLFFAIQIPYVAASTLLFLFPFFYIVGFDRGDVAYKFGSYWLYHGLYVLCMVYQGQLVANLCPSLEGTFGMKLHGHIVVIIKHHYLIFILLYVYLFDFIVFDLCFFILLYLVLGNVLSVLNSLFAGFYISGSKIPVYWKWLYDISTLHYALEGLIFSQAHHDHTAISTLFGQRTTIEDFYPQAYSEWSYDNNAIDVLALIAHIVVLRIILFIALKYVRHESR